MVPPQSTSTCHHSAYFPEENSLKLLNQIIFYTWLHQTTMKASVVLSHLVLSMAPISGVQAAAMGDPAILARQQCNPARRADNGKADFAAAASGNHTNAVEKRAWDGVGYFTVYAP
jgi:hypothetical protein